MEILLISVVLVVLSLGVLASLYARYVKHYRTKMIETYSFPDSISKKVHTVYPHLNERELQRVIETLRDYFQIVNLAGKNKATAMPSQVVDVAWHEFILFTQEYHRFCKRALGRYIHHTPAEAMKSKTTAQKQLKRTWRIACFMEHISPASPARLPRIFAIDSQLKIEDGFKYALNCKKSPNDEYCASHIGCSSGCSGSAGVDGCSGGASGSSGSSGGCSGGGGCGGS